MNIFKKIMAVIFPNVGAKEKHRMRVEMEYIEMQRVNFEEIRKELAPFVGAGREASGVLK